MDEMRELVREERLQPALRSRAQKEIIRRREEQIDPRGKGHGESVGVISPSANNAGNSCRIGMEEPAHIVVDIFTDTEKLIDVSPAARFEDEEEMLCFDLLPCGRLRRGEHRRHQHDKSGGEKYLRLQGELLS